MKYILLLMFFVTPPGKITDAVKGTKNDPRIWQLQSTATMEFETQKVCEEIGQMMYRNTFVTATVWTEFFCFPKTEKDFEDLINSQLSQQNKSMGIVPGKEKRTPQQTTQRQRDDAIDRAMTFVPRRPAPQAAPKKK